MISSRSIARKSVLTILSSRLAIKVDISESEITKISVLDKAEIILDALGDEIKFIGTVTAIEPAETKVSGVVYYKITIMFDNNQSLTNVRPGMTANVSVLTDQKDMALVVPQRSVLEKDGKKIIRVVKNKEKGIYEERFVDIGLKGNYGEVEVLSGLAEGEEIITFLKEKK